MADRMIDSITAPALSTRIGIIAAYPSSRARFRALLEREPDLDIAFEDSAMPADVFSDEEADALLVEIADEGDLPVREVPGPAVVLVDAGDRPLSPRPAVAYLARDAASSEILAALNAVREGLAVFDPALLAALGRAETLPSPGVDQITGRELDVLRLVADGLTNKAIARQLGISDHTVKFHVGAILAKLGAESRTEAVSRAARSGLLPL